MKELWYTPSKGFELKIQRDVKGTFLPEERRLMVQKNFENFSHSLTLSLSRDMYRRLLPEIHLSWLIVRVKT